MKARVIVVALCMSSLGVTGVFAADDEAEMRKACPKSDFETWDKAEARAACEKQYREGPVKSYEYSDGYVDDAERRERRVDRPDRIERPSVGPDIKGRIK